MITKTISKLFKVTLVDGNNLRLKTRLKPLFQQLNFLKVDSSLKWKLQNLWVKCIITNFQKFFLPSFRKTSATHSYTTRNAVSDKFYIPKTLQGKTDQSIQVIGPKTWNALPSIVTKKSNNIPLFKKLIKYFVWCSRRNRFSLIISFVVVTFFTHKSLYCFVPFICVSVGVKKFFMHDD